MEYGNSGVFMEDEKYGSGNERGWGKQTTKSEDHTIYNYCKGKTTKRLPVKNTELNNISYQPDFKGIPFPNL